jgi:hypothetical protein
VCEGEKTEPNYFKSFKTNDDLIRVEVSGAGRGKHPLVEYAAKLKKEAETKRAPYSVVWCVFDRDAQPDEPGDKNNFNKAILSAKKNQIKVAYSNDAFEIWYILHFSFHQTGWHRDQYKNKLTDLLGEKYQKNDPGMYIKLKNKQPRAIDNARKLLALYSPLNPESDNPSTTVHILVEFLNEYLAGE